MKYSIIMPSYLGKYKHAAANRDQKIVRAVNSVLKQTFGDLELIIIADGCRKTVNIIRGRFNDGRIKLFHIKKAKKWSGIPRNAGIQEAKGEFILYLDIDDIFGSQHVEIIENGIKDNPGHDWYWFNDLSYNKKTNKFDEHIVNIYEQGACGTSNVCHRRDMKVYWGMEATYLHDWVFINRLKAKSDKHIKIPTPQYGVCHVPHLLDV